MAAYSFGDVNCVLTSPSGNLILSEAGVAEEGITIARTGDQNTMSTGATRGGMHNLAMSRAGRITIRFLKNSPMNAELNRLANAQFQSGATHGVNTITLSNRVFGDEFDCTECAFVRYPDGSWAKVGANYEWMFDSLDIAQQIGNGTLAT